jgi:hypothetical protein
LFIAEKLGKTLSELQASMTLEELMLWIAYYNQQADEQREANKKQAARRR